MTAHRVRNNALPAALKAEDAHEFCRSDTRLYGPCPKLLNWPRLCQAHADVWRGRDALKELGLYAHTDLFMK